jgi:membrane protease YdiL (CAAX protease family)
MTDGAHNSPYQSFLNQTLVGDSRVWTWLVGIWFAITIWFYGQIILSVPLTGAAIASDPGGFEGFMESMPQTGSETDALPSLAIALIAPVFAFIFWLFRKNSAGETRKPMLVLGAIFAVTSFAALIHSAISSADPAQGELLSTWMARSPFVYLFMLLMFPPFAIALWIYQRKIHKRTILSLHTAASRFRWKRLGFAMLVFWVVAGPMSYIGHSTGMSEAEFVFDPSKFWKYLPITLLFIPLQSATEEIALRGYLNQGLGHYIKNPWIVFIITSAAFASLHLGNPEVAEGTLQSSKLMAVSGYFLFGMFACLLTYIDGGLETAIGVHAANNMFAAAIVGYESSALPTPTVFRVGLNTEIDTFTTIIALSVVCFVMYMTRRALD